MSTEELIFEGCNFFRQRLTYSVLSGRPITITNIRKDDDAPGIRDFEAKLIALLEKITNGTRIEISATGTQVRFRPGIITGGVINMDCGADRCLSYFLEPIIIISPFCKNPMTIKLKGVTNAPGELSVDAIRATWLCVYNKFVLNDEKLELKIMARGLKPSGGGCVTFSASIYSQDREKQGKVCKIRGQAYVTKVTPSLAYRMIDSAKKMLHGYISDVYITVDQRKGDAGGSSPGYGLFLTAETTEGVVYHGEALSKPKGEAGDPIVAEDVGTNAAVALLEEIYRGGCLDSSAQVLACSFMALGQKDVSKFLFGPLTVYSVHALRHLKSFFEIQFKVDEWTRIRATQEDKQEDDQLRLAMTHAGLPLSDEIWRFFIEGNTSEPDKRDQSDISDWKWLRQVADLPQEDLDISDPFAPAVKFSLECETYWIALRPTQDFPLHPPEVCCAFQQAFTFEWMTDDFGEQHSTLSNVVQSYRDYCSTLDLAFSEIKRLDCGEMVLISYALHEDDPECVTVEVREKNDEIITLLVDWRNLTEFPRFISSSNTERFTNLNCDLWDANDALCNNLLKILEEEPQEGALIHAYEGIFRLKQWFILV
ncbi:hypothetical protein Q1695_010971 [Nippostrongylus brasiliensis]|nr:hypothetical protein Q1695_010971 [Nippostrongylus brasiliensis]